MAFFLVRSFGCGGRSQTKNGAGSGSLSTRPLFGYALRFPLLDCGRELNHVAAPKSVPGWSAERDVDLSTRTVPAQAT